MAIVARMREQLREAMKARDAVRMGVLRYWIAQLTLGTGEEVPDDQAVKKMRGVLKEAREGHTSFSPEELEILREWVPPTWGAEQIREALEPVADKIRAAPKEGVAMGIAMKSLAGQPVDADDVKAAVAALRG